MADFIHLSKAGLLQSRPHTPPITAFQANARRSRSCKGSPASRASSVHPQETTSPARHIPKGLSYSDIEVIELLESESMGIPPTMLVYPIEEPSSETDDEDVLEHNFHLPRFHHPLHAQTMSHQSPYYDTFASDDGEAADEDDDDDDDEDDDDDDDEEEDDDDESTASDSTDEPRMYRLTHELSGLSCGGSKKQEEVQQFRENREQRRRDKREDLRAYKRSHSKSAHSESGAQDSDAMDDQDCPISQRRLRRRTRGPGDLDWEFEQLQKQSYMYGGVVPALHMRTSVLTAAASHY